MCHISGEWPLNRRENLLLKNVGACSQELGNCFQLFSFKVIIPGPSYKKQQHREMEIQKKQLQIACIGWSVPT